MLRSSDQFRRYCGHRARTLLSPAAAHYDSLTEYSIWEDLQKKIFTKNVEFEDLFLNEQMQHWSYLDFLLQIAPYSKPT